MPCARARERERVEIYKDFLVKARELFKWECVPLSKTIPMCVVCLPCCQTLLVHFYIVFVCVNDDDDFIKISTITLRVPPYPNRGVIRIKLSDLARSMYSE